MRANALVVMAKAPLAGESKTRLVPIFTPAEAAEISRCLLLDLLDEIRVLTLADRFIAFTPEPSAAWIERLSRQDFEVFPQQGRDLGERMHRAIGELFGRGYKNVLLIGGDLPVLPVEHLAQGYELLERPATRVVLGPSRDGGYYLIGMKAPAPQIFQGIAWSTGGVFAATVAKLDELHIAYSLLPQWFDIDTVEDLRYLKTILAKTPDASAKQILRLLNDARLD